MRRNQRSKLLFALLLAICRSMVNAQPAWALQIRDTIYYSDASKTTMGEVYSDPARKHSGPGHYQRLQDVYTSVCVPTITRSRHGSPPLVRVPAHGGPTVRQPPASHRYLMFSSVQRMPPPRKKAWCSRDRS